MEEAMSITPIIFVLVILLFGFDSAGQVTAGKTITANDRTRGRQSSELSIFK